MSQPAPPPKAIPRPVELSEFDYEAQTADGLALRGTMSGHSAEEVQARLTEMQLRVLAVRAAELAAGKGGRRGGVPMGPDDFLIFNRQLAHLAAAGLPVERGLQLIAEDMNTGRLAGAARAVAAELEKGMPLAEAFGRHASRFPPLYGKLVDAGVQAGNLPAMLFNLGHHLELVGRLRQTLWRTLSYPAAVLGAMLLVMLFVSQRVLPQFRQMYEEFRTTVPLLTRIILALGDVYVYFLAGLAGLVLAAVIGVLVLRFTGRGGMVADTLLVKVPIIGPVLRAGLLARWIDALRLGVDAGLDLPRAIALASEATASPRLKAEGAALAEAIAAGRPMELHQGRLLPATVPAAIELASHTGELPATLATLARMYQQQAEHRLRVLPSLLTPIFLFVVTAVVMTGIAALLLPMVRLIQSIAGGDLWE